MRASIKFLALAATLVASVGALEPSDVQASTTQMLCVDPNGNGCATTISAAIAMITGKNTQILVSSGVYTDTVAINTGPNPSKLTITIIGSGADFVIINGNGSSVFSIGPKATVTLMGMKIANGAGQATSSGVLAGGGIFASDATLTVTECIITNNQANFGAGIYASDTKLNITSSSVTGNSAPSLTTSDGGGIYFAATKASKLTMQDSIIDSNTAFAGGGLMLINPKGASAKPSASISDTTISNNSAISEGGGILVEDAKLSMINTTISGNSQSDTGGQGAGLWSSASNVTVNNVTIANNTAAGFGGGVDIDASNKKFVFSNTIVAGNTATTSPDCFASGKSMNSHDYNLIGDTTGCTIVGKVSHNLTGVASTPLNPLLAALADNGGNPAPDTAPETQALMPGSPALGKGNPATPNGKGSNCEPTDETGLLGAEARTKGDCDIGAYQLPD